MAPYASASALWPSARFSCSTCKCILIDKFRILWLPWATHRKVSYKMAVWTATLAEWPSKRPFCTMIFYASPRITKTYETYYRKRGSASYIVREVLSVRERERERHTDRQRERERDGSDVTIVALKLAINSHFPLPKIRNWRRAYTFPCQKFALLVSPFTLLVSPFTERLPLSR